MSLTDPTTNWNPKILSAAATIIGVALCLAILFPIASQCRCSTKSADVSHHKQAALAILMYADDHDQRLPPAKFWMSLSHSYAKDAEPFSCPPALGWKPHAPHPSTPRVLQLRDGLPFYTGTFGHAMNMLVGGHKDFEDPAATVLTYCSSHMHWNAHDAFVSYAERFNGGFNVTFLDSHAKFTRTQGAQLLRRTP